MALALTFNIRCLWSEVAKRTGLNENIHKDFMSPYLSFSWHFVSHFPFSHSPPLGASSCVGFFFSLFASASYLNSLKDFPQNVLCESGQKWKVNTIGGFFQSVPHPLPGGEDFLRLSLVFGTGLF